jgi:hypothetical protein
MGRGGNTDVMLLLFDSFTFYTHKRLQRMHYAFQTATGWLFQKVETTCMMRQAQVHDVSYGTQANIARPDMYVCLWQETKQGGWLTYEAIPLQRCVCYLANCSPPPQSRIFHNQKCFFSLQSLVMTMLKIVQNSDMGNVFVWTVHHLGQKKKFCLWEVISATFYNWPAQLVIRPIQGVNRYMLQRSVADRWVQSDHILLIHPCTEKLLFGTKGHNIFRDNA